MQSVHSPLGEGNDEALFDNDLENTNQNDEKTINKQRAKAANKRWRHITVKKKTATINSLEEKKGLWMDERKIFDQSEGDARVSSLQATWKGDPRHDLSLLLLASTWRLRNIPYAALRVSFHLDGHLRDRLLLVHSSHTSCMSLCLHLPGLGILSSNKLVQRTGLRSQHHPIENKSTSHNKESKRSRVPYHSQSAPFWSESCGHRLHHRPCEARWQLAPYSSS